MSQSLQLTIKSSIFDRVRALSIEEAYIQFDDRDLIAAPPTIFQKNEIAGLKYGVNWISGYKFVIGRIYCIDVLSNSNKIIKIRLKSVYGVRKKALFEKYAKIINAIYENFIADMVQGLLSEFENGEVLSLAGIQMDESGVILNDKSEHITWLNLGIRGYSRYYSIYSIANPDKYKLIEYSTEWQAAALLLLLNHIVKRSGIQNANEILNSI